MAIRHMIRISNWISLAKNQGYEIPVSLTSRSLRDAAANATIPAEMVANVWCVREDDVHQIAASFGMKRPTATKRAA